MTIEFLTTFSEVAHSEIDGANLIVQASRSSNSLLAQFQKDTRLKIELTNPGIMVEAAKHNEEVDKRGYHRAYVVVTNWTLKSGFVHTYIASNHTRELGAVANFLVDEDKVKSIAGLLLNKEGNIAAITVTRNLFLLTKLTSLTVSVC